MKNYSKIITIITGTFLMTAFIMMPAFAFAKENEKGKGNNEKAKQEKSEMRENKENKKNKNEKNGDEGCFRAFGHLIAPGWIKHNGQISIGSECRLPFGIAKKFRGTTGTTTPPTSTVDTNAPTISSVRINPRVTSAVVRWTTNERANGTVYVSTQSPVNISASTTKSVTRTNLVRDHELVIGSLTASTTYYAAIYSRDQAGNLATSSEVTFTTKTAQTPVDTNPPVVSSIVSVSGTTTINVNWITNEFATSRVYYTASSTVDVNASTTSFVEKTSLDKNHVMTVSGLTASTTYALVVESIDATGNITRSPAFSVTTGAPVVVPPVVDATAPVISNSLLIIGTSTAQISWTTNENATAKAFYSTSSPVAFAATTTPFVENTSLTLGHALMVSGLSTSTPYYMVLESRDTAGNTVRSTEFSFVTASGI